MMVWCRMDNGKEQRRHKSSVVLVEKSAPKQADGSTQNIVNEKPKSFHPGNRVKIIWDRTPVPGKSTQGWTKTVRELETQKGTIEKVSHHYLHIRMDIDNALIKKKKHNVESMQTQF